MIKQRKRRSRRSYGLYSGMERLISLVDDQQQDLQKRIGVLNEKMEKILDKKFIVYAYKCPGEQFLYAIKRSAI